MYDTVLCSHAGAAKVEPEETRVLWTTASNPNTPLNMHE